MWLPSSSAVFRFGVLAAALAISLESGAATAADTCTHGTGAPWPAAGDWIIHDTGFALTGLDGLVVECGQDAVSIVDPALPERTSGPARIWLLPEPPLGDWPEARLLANGTEAYSRMTIAEGGSGGAEYRLTAWVALQDGTLIIEQQRQFEPGFGGIASDAWTLVWNLLAEAMPAPE